MSSYTEEDVRAEAARQYKEILSDSGYTSVGERMDGESRWRGLDDDDWDKAANAVEDLLDKVADLSRWAVDMGAEALVPAMEEVTIRDNTGRAIMRVHFAFEPELTRESQTSVMGSVAQHLSNTLA